MGILIKNKTLYHGSNIPDIEFIENAENATLGVGAYFSDAKNALYYA